MTFSVIIPLYNKEAEIADTLASVLAQSLMPDEIIVVDDGSTDGSAAIVEGFTSPLVKLIRQPNAGVSAARNRAIAEAKGDYIALLDADDRWQSGFLEEVSSMIEEFPDCGLYATAFLVDSFTGLHSVSCPDRRGVVDNFFRRSMTQYIVTSSTSVVPRHIFDEVGGFPVGMRLGEDQYMWTKIATDHAVCFSPERLSICSSVASNRSAAIYKPEQTDYSFEDFYDPAGDASRNEFIARVAIGKAIDITVKGGTEFGRRTEKFFAYTTAYRRGWRKLWLLNRLPLCVRRIVHPLYQRLAWALARRGL